MFLIGQFDSPEWRSPYRALIYVNEFFPRNSGNQIVNAILLTLTFNNLFKNLSKNFFIKMKKQLTRISFLLLFYLFKK
jgi:hypothetical protein